MPPRRFAGKVAATANEPAMTAIKPEARDLLRALERQQPGTTADLLRLFAVDAPVLLQRLYGAHAMRDAEGLAQAAHYLRSSALALGLADVETGALALERDAVAALDDPGTRARLDDLRGRVESAVRELGGLIGG